MSFGGNTTPKKFGKSKEAPKKSWLCGCKRTQPHYPIRCPRCGKGRP